MARPRSERIIPARVTVPEPPPADDRDEDEGDGLVTDVGDIAQLADPTYRDWLWWVYRMRTPAELQKEPAAKARVIVTKVVGPLDVSDIQQRFGGGVYEFWGYFDGRLRMKPTYELDGPRKVWESPPPPAPAPAPPTAAAPAAAPAPSANGTALDRIATLLEQQQQQINRLQGASAGLSVGDVIKLLPLLRGEGSGSGGEMVKEMVSLFRMGAEVRGTVEGGADKSTMEIVIEKLAPSIERIAGALLTRRVPRRPPPAGAANASHAEVVNEPAEPASEAQPSVDHRWLTAAESLAEAIAADDEPGDFALTLERILSAQQFAILRLATTDQVLTTVTQLDPNNALPILRQDPARAFVDAVLAEIRNPSGDDDSGAPAES